MTKVLIVDDVASNRDLLSGWLKIYGYDTIEAINGEDGLNKALLYKPDIILLDIMMPVMNGLEMCLKIRRKDMAIPIIFISARLSAEIDAMCVLGDCFMEKPVDLEKLITIMAKTIKEKNENISN